MNRTKLRPTYSLDEAKSLARSGKMIVNGRVRRHLMFLENPSRSIWMGLCMVFTQMSTCAEVLNARIGTLSFQLIPKEMHI